jgi:hypothetical protein
MMCCDDVMRDADGEQRETLSLACRLACGVRALAVYLQCTHIGMSTPRGGAPRMGMRTRRITCHTQAGLPQADS